MPQACSESWFFLSAFMSFWLSFPMKTFSGAWQSGGFQNGSSVLVLKDNVLLLFCFPEASVCMAGFSFLIWKSGDLHPYYGSIQLLYPITTAFFKQVWRFQKIRINMFWRVYIESLRISFDGADRIMQLLVFGMTLKISLSNSIPHTVGKDATHSSILSTIFSCFPS